MKVNLATGFTLLEMLVVLTLIGILAGLALPNFSKMLDSFTEATTWREVEAEISGLPLRAFNEGRMMTLTTASARSQLRALPADWQIEVKEPVRYQSSGWCEGGRLRVRAGATTAREYVLVAPRCEIAVGAKA